MNIHIHDIETGNQCRKHQDDGQTCHTFHDRIHIIGDNRLQKTLVYFNTTIRGNEVMIGKLRTIFQDTDYLDTE